MYTCYMIPLCVASMFFYCRTLAISDHSITYLCQWEGATMSEVHPVQPIEAEVYIAC